jgi:hypothetical protein
MPGTRPPEDTLYIPTNGTFERYWTLKDAETGGVPDMTGWYGACEVRNTYQGSLITKFATGTDPVFGGTLDFDGVGNMRLYLPIASVRVLTPISNAVFDIALLNPVGEWFIILVGKAHILSTEVTNT